MNCRRAGFGRLPLLLVGLAAGGGAALGLVQAVPLMSASQVVRATVAEPGASFVLTVQVTGPESTLYMTGTGFIDFSSGNSALTAISHRVGLDGIHYSSISRQRVVGRHLYLESSITAPETGGWVALPTSLSPDPDAVGGLGSIDAEVLGAMGARPQWLQLVPVGSSELNGVAVNRYQLVYTGPTVHCPLSRSAVEQATDIWIDGANRLRRTQTTISMTSRGPIRTGVGHSVSPAAATTTQVVDFRITSFGRQPLIVAPPVARIGYPVTAHSGSLCPE